MDKYGSLINNIDAFMRIAEAESRVFGPYTKENGRKIVIIIKPDGSRRTVSYPKYIMEQHLGRELDPETETVDHWDSNKDNNDITNLRLVPRKEHSADDTRRVKLIDLTCAMCGKHFQRSPRLLRDKAKKKNAGPFCSKQCSGRYSRLLKLKQIKKIKKQPFINSEYYKRKYE